MLFNVHSHSKPDGEKGGSGYIYDRNPKTGEWYFTGKYSIAGSDGVPATHLYNTNESVMPMYVYHRYSKGLYQYTPVNPAARKWLNIKSGAQIKSIIYH